MLSIDTLRYRPVVTNDSIARALGDSGSIAGAFWRRTALPGARASQSAWILTNGTRENLAAVPFRDGRPLLERWFGRLWGSRPPAGLNSVMEMNDINSKDQAAGAFGYPFLHACIWEKGTLSNIAAIVESRMAANASRALAITNGGIVLGVCGESGSQAIRPFLSSGCEVTDLSGALGRMGVVTALNERGWVCGQAVMDGRAQAILLRDGKTSSLGTVEKRGKSFARCVNYAGEVAGDASVNGSEAARYDPLRYPDQAACVWRASGLRVLAALPGANWSVANALNDSGVVAGSCAWPADPREGQARPVCRAVMWLPDGSVVDLNRFVPAGSGLRLHSAIDVNSRGQLLCWAARGDQEFLTALLVPG